MNSLSNITPTNERNKRAKKPIQKKVNIIKVEPPEFSKPLIGTSQKKSKTECRSVSSNIHLGNWDLIKVSLEDFQNSTSSKRAILKEWGTEGTMVKILNGIKMGMKPLNIKTLLSKGPLIPEFHSIIMARCFASVLNLKQHGFIKIYKDPVTFEIIDIALGQKFEKVKYQSF